MRKSLLQTLMDRDNLTVEEAEELIEEARDHFNDCLAVGDTDEAEETCMDFFGLESNYLDEFM